MEFNQKFHLILRSIFIGLIRYPMIHPINPTDKSDQSVIRILTDGPSDIRIARIRIAPLLWELELAWSNFLRILPVEIFLFKPAPPITRPITIYSFSVPSGNV